MPFWKKERPVDEVHDPRQRPMRSGLRLRSSLTRDEWLRVLEQAVDSYRPRSYEHMPAYVTPGWSWNSRGDEPPVEVISFNDGNDDFILAALWDIEGGTEIGLFPLIGGGDEHLETMAIVSDLQQRDQSLTAVGVIPGGTVMLAPPRVTEEMIAEGVTLAGLPASDENVSNLGRALARHLLIKAAQVISSRDPRAADRFIDAHRWNGGSFAPHCQAILDDVVAWDTGVLPPIQEVPVRMRSLIMEGVTDSSDLAKHAS